jgi:hypothetical protein
MRSAELVGVAQTIACCGEMGGVGDRREIAQSRMWPSLVVIVDPVSDLGPGMIEAEEQALVQQFGLRQQMHQDSDCSCPAETGCLGHGRTVDYSIAERQARGDPRADRSLSGADRAGEA